MQLKSAAWAKYGGDNLVVLNRNLTIRSTVKPFGLMDFQQLERKILINPGVTVMFESIVLQNVRYCSVGQYCTPKGICIAAQWSARRGCVRNSWSLAYLGGRRIILCNYVLFWRVHQHNSVCSLIMQLQW